MNLCHCDYITELKLVSEGLRGGSKGVKNSHEYFFVGVKGSFRRSNKIDFEHVGLLCSGYSFKQSISDNRIDTKFDLGLNEPDKMALQKALDYSTPWNGVLHINVELVKLKCAKEHDV